MPHEVGSVVRPQSTVFPGAVRVVNSTVHTTSIESQRIRDAEMDPFFRLSIQSKQRVGVRAGSKRRVLSESAGIVLIDPVVIMEVGRNVRALQLRTVGFIQRPALSALAAVGLCRSI